MENPNSIYSCGGELKPCPFCGERLIREAGLWVHPYNDCFLARAGYDYREVVVGDGEDMVVAEKAWNTRAYETE